MSLISQHQQIESLRVEICAPSLCTGFDTSLKQIAPLFDWSKGYAALTENDESTPTLSLFVSGPWLLSPILPYLEASV